jgi:predicted dehydrogenase
MLVSEIRGLYTGEVRNSWTWHFYGTEGYMYIESGKGYEVYMGRKKTPEPHWDGPEPVQKGDDGTSAHYRNFIEAIRANKPEMLAGEIEKLHLSCALCHLGNISYRLHRPLTFDAKTERFVGDLEADRLLCREYRKPYLVSDSV